LDSIDNTVTARTIARTTHATSKTLCFPRFSNGIKNRPSATQGTAQRLSSEARAADLLTNAPPHTLFQPPRGAGTARIYGKFFLPFRAID
jgi:hypothetical protein